MYKSSIFQKNINSNSLESEKALNFDNCDIVISKTNLTVTNNGQELLRTELTLLEEDFSTISYLGKYPNGVEFRVIRPTDLSLSNLKQSFDCESAFSIASISPSGYAVHFILTQN